MGTATGTLRLVLGDQLHPRLAALTDLDPGTDTVLMVEVADETTYVRHHKQKIALVLSAMRHFAQELRAGGVAVDYVALEDAGNTGSFTGELARAVARHRPGRVVVTEPGEWRVWTMMQGWRDEFGVPVEIRTDTRFLCPRDTFARWAEGRESLRMETFYRAMRRRTGLLMRDGAPVGGRWNFDHDNRRRLPADHRPPERLRFPPDAVTREVIALVARRFPDHFGDLDAFGWPVTRRDALRALAHFVEACLPQFGDYQDAMRADAPFLYHALIAPALNLGLLDAEEVCREAERAYEEGHAPLNAAEGFIRQILGWREYVRGLYWARMPDYAATNALGAERDLPWFYWSGETAMRCLADSVRATRRHAHAHHIQRLMVLGNFALLAGVRPAALEEWFLAVYADAYEWVELPNVHGMALWADGGILGSKPYAASGAYIDRMSDYCRGCAYDVRLKEGPAACPFNALYWSFLIHHADRLRPNPRLAMPYRTLDRMSAERRRAIVRDAARFLDGLSERPPEGEGRVETGTPDLFLEQPAG
ncbi:cryptochrome/photolyase family protein [Methylobacterium isbiliense]|uniref:(6-4) photolyase n=1 Tax=Methylobacterium isbiliense TaxID=315478 RepID=A0ABQ4SCM7_9HYPH|nr:cryptochrome/photolyase family protein [Methylobacterium isbiliense]MDN3621919.1 cryptochrome/photolyase family protein [Methylobacterium isbiliense]GJD99567.1 (6-4) photolyase [Methylobacterium isbiliense]